MVREATAWMLTDAGHTVHEAEDGVVALDHLLNRDPIDLLITDINMPRMDGLALVQQAHLRWPSLPVLLVSGRPQPQGTQPYMAKPFGWATLMEAVARIIAKRADHAKPAAPLTPAVGTPHPRWHQPERNHGN